MNRIFGVIKELLTLLRMFYRKKDVILKLQGHLSFRDYMLNLGRVFNFLIAKIEKHQVWHHSNDSRNAPIKFSLRILNKHGHDIWSLFPDLLF